MDEKNRKRNFKVNTGWVFWVCVAAMVIGMMHYGYSCTGCGECVAPRDGVSVVSIDEP